MLRLSTTICGTWKLGIGDPTIRGWVTTAAFITAALLCLAYAYFPEPHRGHRMFWTTLGLALLVFGINKQLDFQWLLHEVAKDVSKKQGWYSQRRTVEMLFVFGLVMVSLLLLTFIWWAVHHAWQQRWLAFCGIVLLVAFIIVRAVRIHEVYEMLKLEPPGLWLRTMLECGGASCIGVAALLGIANYRKKTKCECFSRHLNGGTS